MNTLDKQYLDLLQDILDNGVRKEDRTGTGTISVFGRQIRHKMSEGFPLLTTKKMPFKTITTELLWFLRGDTNIKFLVDNNCHIWDGDAYKNYCEQQSRQLIKGCTYQEFINKIKTDTEFAKKWGELGPVYGKQWRGWHFNAKFDMNGKYHEEKGIDQIQNLINDLKTNPDSRRLMVTAWNVGELDSMTLPPCHYGFQVYTRELSTKERLKLWIDRCTDIEWKTWLEEAYYDWDNPKWGHKVFETDMDDGKIPTRSISLMFNMRSCDVPLGLPFNIASYGLLLEIIGKMVNMVPDELIASLGDAHIYKNQVNGIKEQLTREPYQLPTLIISDEIDFTSTIDDALKSYNKDNFKLVGYESHPSIKIPLSN